MACRACGLTDTCQFGACIAAPTCTPTTCSAAGKNCGTILNGCGGQLSCGACSTAGESCGGTGVANVCGPGTCVPKTCTDLGKNCGQVSDGCGAFLQCGTCSVAGDSCGGGGTMNVCGHGACVPKSCTDLGKNCGTVSDTCGGQVSCGTCTVSGQSCGGAGTANVCGVGSCTPKTCPQLNATCGTVNDTCGNTLSCGTCSGFETCGGAGTANACGATCIGSCPSGFSCTGGSCTGGNLQRVTFDIPVPPQTVVSGTVTRNGANPAATYCNSTSYGELLEFTHLTDTRFNTSVYSSCNTTGATWAFSVSLYPGSYKVAARRNTNNTDNLPGWETVVVERLTVP